MSSGHRIYIAGLSIIVIIILLALVYYGYSYYILPLEERFYHGGHHMLKPAGTWGHGYGIAGSLFILMGVLLYYVRKRVRRFSRLGTLKHWLEFHIFLCTLGPVLILFHTSFKFGGLVAVSFWSMVAVFVSGIIGRFIYLQIPRTIEGRELSLSEVQSMKANLGAVLSDSYRLDEQSSTLIVETTKKKAGLYHRNLFIRFIKQNREDRNTIRKVKTVLTQKKLPRHESASLLKLVRHEITLNRRIERLVSMQTLFKYWHVAHLPFALVMLVIMLIHIAVTLVFGYRWIF